jgi:hypothetical protein
VNADLSCSCTFSMHIDDGNNNSMTSVLNSVFDSEIFINHARFVQLGFNELGSTGLVINAGSMALGGNAALTSTTITGAGTHVCSANLNITGC